MRHADDISDSNTDPEDKEKRLRHYRATLEQAFAGSYNGSRLLPAFHHTVRQFQIPAAYFHDLLTGAEMDLTIHRYETFDDLYRYCYCVAGTVGLCCVRVFGFKDPAAVELAAKLGIAFQLTNILRDIPEDFRMGRIYVPQEDLRRFGCSEADLAKTEATPAFVQLMKFEAQRAWQFYEEGIALQKLVNDDSRGALWAMTQIYSGILRKIEANGYDVLARPHPRLSSIEKAWIMLRARAGL